MASAPARGDYLWHCPITTRWSDNDVYGHINNVAYYGFFDTAVNRYLISTGVLDIANGNTVGFVVNSGCDYFAPAAYPDALEAGIRVDKLGNSSVTYGVGIFKEGKPEALAAGHFVHVFVEKDTQQAKPMPQPLRDALAAIS